MKNKEIQALSEQELNAKIKEEKDALVKLKINHAVSPIDNPASIRNNRRKIARLLTAAGKRKASK
jgi:large subunit ribosomal protein L29